MLIDYRGDTPEPGARSMCPMCDGTLIAKCGHIVTWHWAHESSDCDPWAEPESQWHLAWKQHFLDVGARIEVSMGEHRADVVTPDDVIVELQAGYLGADDIIRRERFYGHRLAWIYRCHWEERLHFGKRGFWWKNGSHAMTMHRRPVWWHIGEELWNVSLNVVETDAGSSRIVGRVNRKRGAPAISHSGRSA